MKEIYADVNGPDSQKTEHLNAPANTASSTPSSRKSLTVSPKPAHLQRRLVFCKRSGRSCRTAARDTLPTGGIQMSFRKPSIAVLFFFSIIALGDVIREPQFALIRTVDVVQLFVSGMCFGIALASLIAILRTKAHEIAGAERIDPAGLQKHASRQAVKTAAPYFASPPGA